MSELLIALACLFGPVLIVGFVSSLIFRRNQAPQEEGSSLHRQPAAPRREGSTVKLSNINEVNDFIAAVDRCKGDVWLEDTKGDRLSLKSMFSRYIAMGNLLQDKSGELGLFCSQPEDEAVFMGLFAQNPQIV